MDRKTPRRPNYRSLHWRIEVLFVAYQSKINNGTELNRKLEQPKFLADPILKENHFAMFSTNTAIQNLL